MNFRLRQFNRCNSGPYVRHDRSCSHPTPCDSNSRSSAHSRNHHSNQSTCRRESVCGYRSGSCRKNRPIFDSVAAGGNAAQRS
jgi:hypothetical protein